MIDIKDVKRRFGKRVQQLRKERGLTQEQLAEQIGRTVDTISNIETGRASTKIETACKLADSLGVELVDLFGGISDSRVLAERLADERVAKLKERIEDVLKTE